jgi:small GTP-binding protein
MANTKFIEGTEAALELFKQAAEEGWTELDLNVHKVASLPSEIGTLTNLASLEIRGNDLVHLPTEITDLTNLTQLTLRSTKVTSLPAGISDLTNLTDLSLDNNRLTKVPEEICDLKNLTKLRLHANKIRRFPANLKKLVKLKLLSIGANPLSNLLHSISLPINLEELYLPSIGMTTVPAEIFNLTNLRILFLNMNKIADLPRDIEKLISLTQLDLETNKLRSLPIEITRLTNLERLYLGRNPLPIPPETLGKSADINAIFAAIAGLKTGARLNEAKMLVVGDGKVGKSSVIQRLLHDTFNPMKQTTLGVEINDEMNIVQSEVKGESDVVKLNIWDFGGQEIQHSTHQFFLTKRSLYLLVVDARKGDQIGNIEYWLKLIESFGADSPIIVVINQMDQLKGQRELNLDRNALKAKYNIRAFMPTSCETGEGIPALREAIANEVDQLKHVHDVWPPEWVAIKKRLREMQTDYIPVERYFEICSEESLNDENLRESLLDMLHVLGTVIRFPGDTQVLNPRWVTQGVYGLLTSTELVKSMGQFYLRDVGKILNRIPETKGRYPSYTHQRLIDVMEHFQLCFEFTDRSGHYLIPRHLHDNEIDLPWDETDALKFQYQYVETLPDSIISRFIVRVNQFIQKKNYWKNGVFLESGENRAKVKADLVDRKISISILGKEQTRRAFLAIIRAALDEINSNFIIDIKQMIPVPGFPEVLVSYQDLLAYEDMNESEIIIPELRKKFLVRELLDGVEDLNTRLERRQATEPGLMTSRMEMNERKLSQVLRVVVASPSDVQPERDLLPSVIEEVNRNIADRALTLVLTRWETDTYPGFHPEGAQGLIDPILKIADCDLLIGIFWKRFGTATSDGKTGTEHEFGLAYESWKNIGHPQIFVYFNNKSYAPKSKSELEQWGRVLDFKETFPKEGLWWPYRGKVQFERLIRNHLMSFIRNRITAAPREFPL